MLKKNTIKENAIIVLHEIYGLNEFMEKVCSDYKRQGFHVFCPDLLKGKHFLYTEEAEAYQYFVSEVGFDYYKKIEQLIKHLKLNYHKVFIIGFSVGATIAWRCCETLMCDGIICCYGSRIRDYLLLMPLSPVLLIFAEQDSFPVEDVIEILHEKQNIEIKKVKAHHGFMDNYSTYYDQEKTSVAKNYIDDFLETYLL